MSYLALNLLLAIIWMFLFGDFSIGSLVVGFVLGYLGLAFSQPVIGSQQYVRAVLGTIKLIVIFLYELVMANIHLARDILSPVPPFKPGFISFDVRDLGPTETVLLANMISLTPGTLTVDTDDRGEYLYVHSLYAQDPERIRRGFRRFANLIHGALGGEPFEPEDDPEIAKHQGA